MNWRELPLADVSFEGAVDYISVKDIRISTAVNSYAEVRINLVIDRSVTPARYINNSKVTLLAKGEVLFKGICTGYQVIKQDSYMELVLNANSYSYLADISKKNHTFQNPNKTLNDIFEKVIYDYHGLLLLEDNYIISRVITQKDETDWDFLVRISNQERLNVIENIHGSRINIYVGNGSYKIESIGRDAILLEEGKDVDSMRNEMANNMEGREPYDYKYSIYASNNVRAIAGCGCEYGIIVSSEIINQRGVLKNIIKVMEAEVCYPEIKKQRKEAFAARILTGTVDKVDVSTIQVKFDVDDEIVGAKADIPYESVLSNSFYAMPDEKDKVFVYVDNQGGVVCLGSKRTDIKDNMFTNYKKKSFSGLDNIIHFGTNDINISATREYFSKNEKQKEITINMVPNEGLFMNSPELIRIASDQEVILGVTPNTSTITFAQNDIKAYKNRLLSDNATAKAEKAGNYTPLTTIPNYGPEDWKSEEGKKLRRDNEWDNFKTNMKQGVLDMFFYDWWKKDSPLELNTELGEYENGCLFAEAYEVELTVGNATIYFGVRRSQDIEIYAGIISWYGIEPTTNYPIKQDELRDAWEIFMDVVVAAITIAATAVAVAAVVVGTGGTALIAAGIALGVAGAAVSFARGDYFGTITSAVGAVFGVFSKIQKIADLLKGINKVTSIMKLIYSGTQTVYQLPKAWNQMESRIEAQDTWYGKLAEGASGLFTLFSIGTSPLGDAAGVYEAFGGPRIGSRSQTSNSNDGSSTTNQLNTSIDAGGDGTTTRPSGEGGDGTTTHPSGEGGDGTTTHPSEGGEDGATTRPQSDEAAQTQTQPTDAEPQQSPTTDGDPVNVVTGALTEHHTDLRLKDIRGDFRVVRSYKSTKKNPGRMLGERWLFQFETSLCRDGNECSVYLPDDHLETFSLNEKGEWSNVVADKNRYSFTEEANGYLLRDMLSHDSYFFGKDGFIQYAEDSFGNRMVYTYDGKLIKRITLESGQYLEFYYEGKKLSRLVDGQGRKYEYYYVGELLESVIYPNGGILRYEYTQEGYITRIHNENGKVYLNNHFDRKGRVVRQETADGEEYVFFYNDAKRETTVTKIGLNRSVTYQYNCNNLVECTLYEDGTTLEKKYDANEKIVWEKDRMGNETRRNFNRQGQIEWVQYPNGLECRFTYNERGKCISKTNNQGKNYLYTYDEKGAIKEASFEVEKGRFSVIKYEIDSHGRVLSQTYPDGAKKTWEYKKPFEQPTAYCGAENDEIQYELDEYGRKSVLRNAQGEIHYAYNSLHFVTMVSDEEEHVTRYTYDLTGRRTGIRRPEDVAADDGRGITYRYDAMDHLLGVEDACGNVYARKVDSEGKLLKLIDPEAYNDETQDGEGVTYRYDANGYCTHRILQDGAVYRYFYDANGNRTKVVLPEDYCAQTDDGPGRTFTYDSMNRLVTERDKQGVLVRKHTYDLAGRLIGYTNEKLLSLSADNQEEICAEYQYNYVGWLVEERIPVRVTNNQIEYRLRTYEYDLRGNVTCEKRYLDYQNKQSRKGRVLNICKKYDKAGRLVRVTDSLGACMEYGYNERNKVTHERLKIREGVYSEREYVYTKSGLLASVIQRADNKEISGGKAVTRMQYDRNGKIVRLITPTGNEILTSYDRASKQIGIEWKQHDGKIRNVVNYTYDRGNRIMEKTMDGRSEQYTYDVCGRRIHVRDIFGKTAAYRYDKNGRLTGYIASQQYDEKGMDGKALTYVYDNDYLKEVVYSDGSCAQELGYNAFGENVFIREAGTEVSFTYDLVGRRTHAVTAGGASQSWEYDPWGHVIGVTDGNGNVTGFTVDGWGRTLQINRADGGVENYAYDHAGNMMEAMDGLGHITRFEYNEMNLLARRIDQAGAEEIFTYDVEGRPRRYRDRNGREMLFDYNLYGELTHRRVVGEEGMEEIFGYTEDGMLDYCIGGGMRYDYSYDTYGRMTGKSASGKSLLSYEYDDYGRMVARVDLTGKRTEYQYDELDRLLKVWDDGVEQASYHYDTNHRLSGQESGALHTSYGYDLDGNLGWMRATLAGEELFSNHYRYDGNGNCTHIERKDSVTGYAYDCMNRLQKAIYPDHVEQYTYDYADNRIAREYYALLSGEEAVGMDEAGRVPGEADILGAGNFREEYLYDERSRLTERRVYALESIVGNGQPESAFRGNTDAEPVGLGEQKVASTLQEVFTYTYDANGNLIKDDHAEYSYDGFNRLSEVKTADGNTQRNRYDAEGLRAELKENGELVRFLYHNGEVIAETGEEQPTIRYIRGIGLISSDSEEAKFYYHYVSDERGSITDIVKAAVRKKLEEDAQKEHNEENAAECQETGVLNHYEYDAFGNTLECKEEIENRFRFTGEIYDVVTGQYYLRARFYNPVLGRFTQEDDRYTDGLNLYAYCRNNPVKYRDPSGRSTTSAADRSWIEAGADPETAKDAAKMYPDDASIKPEMDKYMSWGLSEEQARAYAQYEIINGKTAAENKAVLENYQNMPMYRDILDGGNGNQANTGSTASQAPDPYAIMKENGVPQTLSDAEIGSANQVDLQMNANQSVSKAGADVPRTIPQQLTRDGQVPAIGKMRDLNTPGNVVDGEFKVADYLPDMGNPKDNWHQNSGILRSVMNEGVPIKDVSPFPMDNAGFLGAERNLLQSRGWTYLDGYWYPPE